MAWLSGATISTCTSLHPSGHSSRCDDKGEVGGQHRKIHRSISNTTQHYEAAPRTVGGGTNMEKGNGPRLVSLFISQATDDKLFESQAPRV